MKKMTKANKLAILRDYFATQGVSFEFDVNEFLDHEIALLARRNASKGEKKALTKVQKENLKLVEMIVTFLEDNKGIAFSAKEVGEALEFDFSSQKMTALLKKVVEEFGATKTQATSNKKLVGYGFIEEGAPDEEVEEFQEA